MATLTKRATMILQGSSSITNASNVIDASDDTYGSITISYKSTKDIVIGGFDFSEIPNGSTINSFSLKSYCGLDAKVSCIMYATRLYESGAFNNIGVTSEKAFGSENTRVVNTISETAPFTVFAGFSAEDLNQKWTNASDYTGIAFYIRYKNSGNVLSGSKKAHPRYFDLTVDYTPPKITVTTNASPSEGGTVTGGGSYESGSTVTITAIPNSGYAFSHWEIGGINVGTTNPISGALIEDTSITAVFEKTTYTISVVASPTEGGSVSGAGVYNYGDTVTLTAEPTTSNNNGTFLYFRFKQWNDGDTTNPRVVTVVGDATYTAEFEQMYMCTAGASPKEGGTVLQTPDDGLYPSGSEVTFTVVANEGYKFVKWEDGSTNSIRTVIVGTSNSIYMAYFEAMSKIYYSSNPAKSVFDTNKNKAKSVWYGKTQIL